MDLVRALAFVVLVLFFGGCDEGHRDGSAASASQPAANGTVANTTTAYSAIAVHYGATLKMKSTQHGDMIIAAGPVAGNSIVYLVNGARIDTLAPGQYPVRTGDTITLRDLGSGSQDSFQVP